MTQNNLWAFLEDILYNVKRPSGVYTIQRGEFLPLIYQTLSARLEWFNHYDIEDEIEGAFYTFLLLTCQV